MSGGQSLRPKFPGRVLGGVVRRARRVRGGAGAGADPGLEAGAGAARGIAAFYALLGAESDEEEVSVTLGSCSDNPQSCRAGYFTTKRCVLI